MTDRQTTHAPGCWDWGPKHYECAVREIKALRAEVAKWKRVADRLAEALALLPDDSGMVEHNPEEGSRMFCCGREVKFDWLHGSIYTHDEDCWYAQMRAIGQLKEQA